MTTFFSSNRSVNKICAPIIGLVGLTMGCSSLATAQTFVASRLGNDPVVSSSTFSNVNATGGDSINGASVIRIPSWIPTAERAHQNARYYMYFSNHAGDDIRLAWSSSITGTWNLWNGEGGSSPDRAAGSRGDNSGTQTPGNGVFDIDIDDGIALAAEGSDVGVFNHVASPDVHVDDTNQRIIMYFHGEQRNPVAPVVQKQKTFIATSQYGLNFNPEANGGEGGNQGMREVVLGEFYFRTFTVGGHLFAYSNNAELWKAPNSNDAGQVNTISNGNRPGGWWKQSTGDDDKAHHWTQRSQRDNPIEQLYSSLGEGVDDPRHFAIYTRTHIDSSDTNVYVFYSSKFDAPESIYMTVIDTRNGSTNPGNWSAQGQELILDPDRDWEGGNLRIATSESGNANGVRQLRDPYVFEDDRGTATNADNELYLFYSGGGEDAIGVARLNPVMHITKRNASGFAIDGGRGGDDLQDVYLWGENDTNVNQKWIEISRGAGFFSYQKLGTSYCLDGANGGGEGQEMYLYTCSATNQNQQWQKIATNDETYRLQKRNAPGFSIDGGNGGEDGRILYLWGSNSGNQNQQWRMSIVPQ